MSDNLAPVETPLVSPKQDEPGVAPVESITRQQELPSSAEAEIAAAATGTTEHDERVLEEHPAGIEQASDESKQKTGMTDVFTEEYTYPRPKRGEIRQAQIIAIRDDGIMVGLGLKREGLIPGYDLQRVGMDIVRGLSVGDAIPVYVVRPEHDQEGNLIVSWYRARQEQDWLDAQGIYERSEIWEGMVRGYNRGGLIVPFGKIRGFVPASHITGISRRIDQASLQKRLAEMVEQTLPLKVLEVSRQNRRLIFSERAARREWRALKRERLLSELQEGDRVHGVVSNVCDFGVFIDIGGTDGLVHISELSWRRTNHPSELVKVGDEVDAYVLRVDRERKRIGLSLRLLQPDPWEHADEDFKVGQVVTGFITKLTDFGAFAALDNGIEGLIHVSELADIPPKHPSEVVAKDAVLPLVIVKIDSKRRRLGLSLKRVSEEEWDRWEEEQGARAKPMEEKAAEELKPVAEIRTEEMPSEGEMEVEEMEPEEGAEIEEPEGIEELEPAFLEPPPDEENPM